jgi:chemotaxis protein CheZ
MLEQSSFDEGALSLARELVNTLESGNHQEANKLLNRLTDSASSTLFHEIGKLTRDLHDRLANFEADLNFADIDQSAVQDAKIRLNYVIEKTDEATNHTLNIIDSFTPTVDELEKDSSHLMNEWARFIAKDMTAEEFRTLTKSITKYLSDTNNSYRDIRSGMNEIVVAQSFQDITGQIIKKVIALVQDVEHSLVRVIKCTGKEREEENDSKKAAAEGPQVPGVQTSEVVSNQDEVDDLLSSLGF